MHWPCSFIFTMQLMHVRAHSTPTIDAIMVLCSTSSSIGCLSSPHHLVAMAIVITFWKLVRRASNIHAPHQLLTVNFLPLLRRTLVRVGKKEEEEEERTRVKSSVEANQFSPLFLLAFF